MEKGGGSPDMESGLPTRISWGRMVMDQGVVTQGILDAEYQGSGTEDDPYIVRWIDNDPRNPLSFGPLKRWFLTMFVALATLSMAFVSTAYTGGIRQILAEFHTSQELATLGVSLFVLGFAVGPLFWAPLSELYGRQYVFFVSIALLTFFNAGAAGSHNMWTLLILRFFAGASGAAPLTNAGGVIADMFPAAQRGIAMSLFSAAPFMGPVLGPIVGGFVGQTVGWRWVEGVMAIFTGVIWISGTFIVPETYAPVLLRRRANRLSKITGKVYMSQLDHDQGKVSVAQVFQTAFLRPWILLVLEPIVLLLSIYMAIIYGTLYMLFGAFPIVFQEYRGWSQGIGGLAFLGIAVGMVCSVTYTIIDNKRYIRAEEKDPGGVAPPEARLPPAMVGCIAIPIGLFWFAWTNSPSVHWIVSILATIPFGFGMVLVFLSSMNYLIDSYTIFAASVLAGSSVLRSLFGAVFPLFTSQMYANLGIHWAPSLPAFLAFMCVPFPFLFYKYGPAIRLRCKYAAEADKFMRQIRGDKPAADAVSEGGSSEFTSRLGTGNESRLDREHDEEKEETASNYTDDTYSHVGAHDGPQFTAIKTGGNSAPLQRTTTNTSTGSRYEANPFDIDRVNTRDLFPQRSRTDSAAVSRTVSRTASGSSSRAASIMRGAK